VGQPRLSYGEKNCGEEKNEWFFGGTAGDPAKKFYIENAVNGGNEVRGALSGRETGGGRREAAGGALRSRAS